MPNPRPNPYIGPRSFRTGEKMYGRERETLELLDLIIAERIVLLYSPSGAGKTSLIQAALFPKLREEGFNVLPPLRVSAQVPVLPAPESKSVASGLATNRFVLSTLLSLEENLPKEKRLSLASLSRLTFEEYLRQRADLKDTSPVLLFDQFEEILTIEPMNVAAKHEFFEQIGEALRNRERWALFSMREDYLAGLDPYIKPIPTRFGTTYRLDLLGVNAAREAIQKPARDGGVNFTDAAADKLINDLRQVHVQRPDGTMELQPGLYVEPVQLQVVCLRLWNNISATQNEIVASDIEDVGDVNSALASYYELRVLAVSMATGESERAVREWFDRQLITEQGIRGQVLMEPERSRGLLNTAIRMFEDAHLVRADERRGATWFELAHDRLIEPIRASNVAWFQKNLSALQQQAILWERQGRPDGLVLRGQALTDAETWAQAHANELTPIEQAFLSECRQARLIREQEAKQNRRIRYLAIGATVLSVIALLGIIGALLALNQLGGALSETDKARGIAEANEKLANQEKERAVTQDRVAKMTAGALSQLDVDPETSLLLATQAYNTIQDIETDDALRQSVNASRLRGSLRGHAGSVTAVTSSLDGKMFATASGDGTVKLWDAANGKEIRTLGEPGAPVWGVTFNSDATKLIATAEDGIVRVWDLAKCSAQECPALEIKASDAPIWNAVLAPNEEWFATSGNDGNIQIWQTADGVNVRTLEGHKGDVNSVAVSPDGLALLSASNDQTARLWNLTQCDEQTCPFQEIAGRAAFWSAAFSPDGTAFVLGSDDQTAYKYDRETLTITNYLSGHSDAVFSVAYSPDGKYIATGSRDGTARIWNATTGQALTPLRGHQDTVWNVTFSPDSKLALTASADQTAKVWTILNGLELRILREHRNRVLDAEYSGDGKRIITVSQDGTALVYDAATGETIYILADHTGWVTGGALNQDGTRAATASLDGTVRVWDLSECANNCTAFDPLSLKAEGHDVVFSPDGKFIAIATADGRVLVYDFASGKVKLTFKISESNVLHVEYSRDGKWLVTASEDGIARLWDVATLLNPGENAGTPKMILEEHGGVVRDANFNPDATLLVTASDDRTARVWDVATGKEKFQLRGHTGPVNAAAFSHDGKWIVTASSDKTARIWDAATGNETAILRGHTDKVQSAEFSPDDQFILTGSSDRTARITLANIARVLELAQQYATRALSCDEWQTLLGDANYCPGGGVAQNVNPYPTLAPITRAAVVPFTPRPIEGATEIPPTATQETSTSEPVATFTPTTVATNAASPTVIPTTGSLSTPSGGSGATRTPTVRPPTPTPSLAPGVYVSKIVFVPLNPGSSPASGQFHVTFLNTTGTEQGVVRWKVLIFEPGNSKSVGDTIGLDKKFPPETSEHIAGPYRIGLGQCQTFIGKVVSEDNESRQTPYLNLNAQEASVEFQMCP